MNDRDEIRDVRFYGGVDGPLLMTGMVPTGFVGGSAQYQWALAPPSVPHADLSRLEADSRRQEAMSAARDLEKLKEAANLTKAELTVVSNCLRVLWRWAQA